MSRMRGLLAKKRRASAGVTNRPRMRKPADGAETDQGHFATYWQKWGRANGKWKPIAKRNPSKGDAVVYGNHVNWKGHVGVVVDVKFDPRTQKVTHVLTVEGNLGDKVTRTGWRKITNLTVNRAGSKLEASGFVSPF